MSVLKKNRIVGQFIREKREALNLSQRALGKLFTPPVTTQFISNLERGVTPLPPSHISVIAQALKISESDLMVHLEKEYALRLSEKMNREIPEGETALFSPLLVSTEDFKLMSEIYEKLKNLSDQEKENFKNSISKR